MKIDSGIGNGFIAGVDKNNRLLVNSVSVALQHSASKLRSKSFQVFGEATLASGTVTPLLITNNSTTETMTVTYVRVQIVDQAGGTALPSAANYFNMGGDLSYGSGGTPKTPVNMSVGSSILSGTTVYQGNPVVSNAVSDMDRYYPTVDGDSQSYSKDGALVVNPGESYAIQFVGDHISGTAYARVSYFMSALSLLE